MKRKHWYFLAVIISLVFSINTAKAEVNTMTLEGHVLWGTNTQFWYNDSVHLHYCKEKIYLKEDTTIINLTKDMGVEAISSLKIGPNFSFYIDGKSKKITQEDVDAIEAIKLSPFSVTSAGGTNILNIDYNKKKNDEAEACLFQKDGISFAQTNLQNLSCGTFHWQGIYHNEETKHDGTIIINSPQMVYLTDNEGNIVNNVKTGENQDLIPVIRSGYPWADHKERFNGDASWTLTDEQGNVIKRGVHTFVTDTADTTMEFVEKFDCLSFENHLYKKMTFKIIYPDQTTDSCTLNVYDRLFSATYLGGGVYGVLDFRYYRDSISECLSLNPDYVKNDYFSVPVTNLLVNLGASHPKYLTFNYSEVSKKVGGYAHIYDDYGFVHDTVSLTESYNALYKEIEAFGMSREAFKSHQEVVEIPRGGEYRFDYSLFVGDNDTPSIEGANKFTFKVAPFVRCFPMAVTAEPSGEFEFTPTVSTGYPFEIGKWKDREFAFYMAFPGDSYEKITCENPKHTVSFSADTSFVKRENRETYTFKHKISDYGVDSLFFVTANDNDHSLDTLCIVKSNAATGIISVKKPESTSDNRIFSIDGISHGVDDANLPKGIYIQNRRKKIIH